MRTRTLLCHIPTSHSDIAMKVVLLQTILAAMMDWIRPFAVVTLVCRAPLQALLVLLVGVLVQYPIVLAHNFIVMRARPDMRWDWVAMLLFPVYKLALAAFRLAGVLHNVLRYSLWHVKPPTLEGRAQQGHDDTPPTPLSLKGEVPWEHMWRESSGAAGGVTDNAETAVSVGGDDAKAAATP